MATLDWHVTTVDGIALVHLALTSDLTERIQIENRIDGPVWPPRTQGVPESGWDEDGYAGVVDADERLVLGYASPGSAVDPPAAIVKTEPVATDATDDLTPTEVVRRLGEAGPPREAVPDPSA